MTIAMRALRSPYYATSESTSDATDRPTPIGNDAYILGTEREGNPIVLRLRRFSDGSVWQRSSLRGYNRDYPPGILDVESCRLFDGVSTAFERCKRRRKHDHGLQSWLRHDLPRGFVTSPHLPTSADTIARRTTTDADYDPQSALAAIAHSLESAAPPSDRWADAE
jgi:hypothetical protein